MNKIVVFFLINLLKATKHLKQDQVVVNLKLFQ